MANTRSTFREMKIDGTEVTHATIAEALASTGLSRRTLGRLAATRAYAENGSRFEIVSAPAKVDNMVSITVRLDADLVARLRTQLADAGVNPSMLKSVLAATLAEAFSETQHEVASAA